MSIGRPDLPWKFLSVSVSRFFPTVFGNRGSLRVDRTLVPEPLETETGKSENGNAVEVG